MTKLLPKPTKFLEVRARVLEPADAPEVLGMCAGYDEKAWRAEDLARHLCKWIPEWALRYGEARDALSSATAVEMLRRAALKVYTSAKYESRGEFGELMLHAVIRHEFDTEPAISKIYFKDSSNDVVKGFDCVHVSREEDGGLDLWLGEAKFYARRSSAISSAADDLREHLDRDYLRQEFTLVCDKVDADHPFHDEIKALLHEERPLGEIIQHLRLPVLLAYDSKMIRDHEEVCAELEEAFAKEGEVVRAKLLENLAGDPPPRIGTIELIVLPVDSKKDLLRMLDEGLKGLQ